MAITIWSKRTGDNGLRPLKPSRDLGDVAALIEEAFADELDRSGRSALREMRWMGRWGFLLGWLDYLSPDVNTNLNGFVWLDNGCIVGNTTVSRNASGSGQWFISNVAVAKTHRRQGIAHQLMAAALEYVKEMRGASVSLQVRKGNDPAIHLYEAVGFRYISATTFFYQKRADRKPVAPFPPGVTLRDHHLDWADAQSAYKLAGSTVLPAHQKERPLRRSAFRLSGGEVHLANFWRTLAGFGRQKHLVVESQAGTFAATLSIEPGTWRADHKVRFMVHPAWWGKLEQPLIRYAINYLAHYPARPVKCRQAEEHQAATETLLAEGFKIRHTLCWMKLTL